MELVKDQILLLLLSTLLIFCFMSLVSSRDEINNPPTVPRITSRFKNIVPISQGYSEIFGHSNIHMLTNNGSSFVNITLDKSSGSGLTSKSKYNYGFFSASIKLPSGISSGVVVAFYLSNADMHPHRHDEIDLEFLGHEKTGKWVLQTNVYGNGSVHTGREERHFLWFDPSQQFHHYSILWNSHHIVFLVDNVPIREFLKNNATSAVYPSKPMSVYATIWDASNWATSGGKYPVDYKYAPFVASFQDMKLGGCLWKQQNQTAPPCSNAGASRSDPVGGQDFAKLTQEQINGLQWSRSKYMTYSYCKDTSRYKVLPPECNNTTTTR